MVALQANDWSKQSSAISDKLTMAAFSFNFSFDSSTLSEENKTSKVVEEVEEVMDGIVVADVPRATIMNLNSQLETIDIQVPSSTIVVPIPGKISTLSFLRVDSDRIELSEELASSSQNSKGASDLVSGVYEGGLRVWEGSLDLISYMHTHRHIIHADNGAKRNQKKSNGKRRKAGSKPLKCLELGCGHGLPGIYVLKSPQPWFVCFSDFNDEVLKSVTWPNVLMNVENKRRFHTSYVSGDWNGLVDVVGELPCFRRERFLSTNKEAEEQDERSHLFDLIISAETCYTESCCEQVAQHMMTFLKPNTPSSVGLVASKRFYFGTGGSAAYFRDCCVQISKNVLYELKVDVVQVIDDGKSNIREIMSVTKNTK